jgi:hypothetical protein
VRQAAVFDGRTIHLPSLALAYPYVTGPQAARDSRLGDRSVPTPQTASVSVSKWRLMALSALAPAGSCTDAYAFTVRVVGAGERVPHPCLIPVTAGSRKHGYPRLTRCASWTLRP